jgi:hypothetical protein
VPVIDVNQLHFWVRGLKEGFRASRNGKNRSVAEIVREAMQGYIQQKRKKKKLFFIGLGSSGRKDVAEKHEELLWKKPAE